MEIHSNLTLVEIIDYDQAENITRSYDILTGIPGNYSNPGGFPQFEPDGLRYTWLEGDALYYQENDQIRTLSNLGARYLFWYEEISSGVGDIHQHL